MPLHQPIAINHSHSSENRIHSDDVARAYGFTGALVPGVAVFGHMTYPLTRDLGVDWLGHSRVELRLLKPAYHGDCLSVPLTKTDEHHYLVECYNAAQVLVAQVTVELPATLPPIDARAQIAGAKVRAPRVEIEWNAIEVDVPFTSVAWTPSVEENRKYTDELSDDLPVYRAGVVHPHVLAQRIGRHAAQEARRRQLDQSDHRSAHQLLEGTRRLPMGHRWQALRRLSCGLRATFSRRG